MGTDGEYTSLVEIIWLQVLSPKLYFAISKKKGYTNGNERARRIAAKRKGHRS